MTISITSFAVDRKNVPYDSFTFSGGEQHIRLNAPRQHGLWEVGITATLTDSAEILKLAMIVDAIRRHCDTAHIILKMPYVPYARQDRVCNAGESLGIRVFCDMINAMKLNEVWILAPHSDVTPALLNNCNESAYLSNWDMFIRDSLDKKDRQFLSIISPDAGAMKRTLKFAQYINNSYEFENTVDVVMADKVRDVRTGEIISTTVHAEHDALEGETCLIYDDICDGGMTFIKLAEELRRRKAKKIILAVPHGIFSKGLREISKVIDQVITTNVFAHNIPEHTSIPVNVFDISEV